MAGNGGGLGGAPVEGMPNHPHPQGTEYTLQGTSRPKAALQVLEAD